MSKIIFFIAMVLFSPAIVLAHTANPHDELIIRMTENGFEPRELTVTEGDEVLFINNDNTDRWPASNFHPTHTLYPKFDPLKSIPPGESWKFTFDKVGTWRMHEHLSPHTTGTIVVLEDPEKVETVKSETETASGFFTRLKGFFSSLWQKIFSKGEGDEVKLLAEFKNLDERAKYAWLEKRAELESPKVAWQYVVAAYDTPEGVVGNPHDLSHLVGQLLYKSYGFEGLSICTPIFAFGCYHGLMEVAFDKARPEAYENNLLAAENGCGTVGTIDSPSYWSCIHGMGHVAATFREYAIEKSLGDCDLLDERVRTYCHDGVFMEFSISALPNFYKKENPIYPCDIVEQSYKSACARSQVQVMRLRLGMDTDAIALACKNTGNGDIIFHCIDALGYFIAQTSEGKSSKIILDCQDIKDEQRAAQCMSAAAGELIFQNYVGWQKAVNEVCQSLSGEYELSCLKRIEQVKQSYGRN